MDEEIVKQIEEILNYSLDIGSNELNERISQLENCFMKLAPKMPEYSLNEKARFINLLTRSHDLIRLSMDDLMKKMNMTPQKLQAIFNRAEHSNKEEDRQLLFALNNLKSQYEDFQKSMAIADLKVTEKSYDQNGGPSTPREQKLKRQKWQKP
jgi:hypothetical protein